MEYNYSTDALSLIDSLQEFNFELFEEWYAANNTTITIQDYLQFIKFGKDCIEQLKNIDIKVPLILHPKLIKIIEISKINLEELKKFYLFSTSHIGSGAVVHYLNMEVK